MIDLYIEGSPAVFKVAVMLEECGLDYAAHHVPVGEGAQHTSEFRAISPNGKVPAIVDHAPADGDKPLAMFESGAILVYLAEKTGLFLTEELRMRAQTLQWLFWQSSGLSPLSGQAIHFIRYAPEETRPYGQLRYLGEVRRHWGVLDAHLKGREWIAGDYSIADMGCFGWVNIYDRFAQSLEEYPDLARWQAAIAARDPVKRAYAKVMAARDETRPFSEKQFQRAMFGEEAAKSMGSLASPKG
jgi:GSH-dependent disulfide-bond oxidoreductase